VLDGGWPKWAVTAVQAARSAPSGANRQPWRFRLEGDALVTGGAGKLYWTAPIDFGIARLHAELGAQHEGVRGSWTMLPEPVGGAVCAPAAAVRSPTAVTGRPVAGGEALLAHDKHCRAYAPRYNRTVERTFRRA
jgi:hypothetical protein